METMRRRLMLTFTASAAALLFALTDQPVWAQGEAALTGTVSSEAEGNMEGVVVTAAQLGSIVRVSVTTDAQGRYAFPQNRLVPGEYKISIRAVGYDIDAPTKAIVEVEKATTTDIKLKKTENLASQLTNAEWMMSIPGTEEQKAALLNCTGCHTLERIVHAIVTEYDMVRPTTEPHDILVDKEGNVWYTDFGEMFIGKFNPKTLKLTEYPIKKFKENAPTGLLSIEFDHTGKIWFDTMYQGSLGCLDPKTGEITYYPLSPEYNDDTVQLNFTGLRYDVDGKIWTKSVGTQHIFRLDLATNKWERFHPTDYLPAGLNNSGIYQVMADSQNNLWMAEFTEGHLGKIDAKTTKVTWYPIPTAHARARRMQIDDQDRVLVTEYRASKVALFDTRSENFSEYKLPDYTFPYRANFDKNGELWASTMHTDRVVRLDPKTGTTVQYLMPVDTNMRTVFVDNSTTPVTFWVGSNHDHRLVQVEPLD
jgi:streptogramin lyase